MKQNRNLLFLFLSVLCVILMVLFESFAHPNYILKSAAKLFLFLCPLILYSVTKKEPIREIIRFRNKKNNRLLILMLIGYALIMLGFFIFRNEIDLTSIKLRLSEKEGINRSNCIFAFLYIMIVNSFLEESFFRGFLYHLGNSAFSKKAGYLISSLLFALYHIGIMSSWFSPLIFLLSLFCLFVTGIVLQYVSLRNDDLKDSYLMHACANLAINTIGFIAIYFH